MLQSPGPPAEPRNPETLKVECFGRKSWSWVIVYFFAIGPAKTSKLVPRAHSLSRSNPHRQIVKLFDRDIPEKLPGNRLKHKEGLRFRRPGTGPQNGNSMRKQRQNGLPAPTPALWRAPPFSPAPVPAPPPALFWNSHFGVYYQVAGISILKSEKCHFGPPGKWPHKSIKMSKKPVFGHLNSQ